MEYTRPLPNDIQQEPEPQTLITHILTPILQNLLGGLGLGTAWMIVTIGLSYWDVQFDFWNAGVWASLMGGLWACFWTVIRFFGDDLGLLMDAYSAGYHSRDAQIAALELELRASYDAQNAAEVNGGATFAINKRQELMQRARKDAAQIVAVAFQGDSISRKAMAGRNMGQRDWERATRLLIAAGAMNGEGAIVAKTPNEALQAVDEKLAIDSQAGPTFAANWQ